MAVKLFGFQEHFTINTLLNLANRQLKKSRGTQLNRKKTDLIFKKISTFEFLRKK